MKCCCICWITSLLCIPFQYSLIFLQYLHCSIEHATVWVMLPACGGRLWTSGTESWNSTMSLDALSAISAFSTAFLNVENHGQYNVLLYPFVSNATYSVPVNPAGFLIGCFQNRNVLPTYGCCWHIGLE